MQNNKALKIFVVLVVSLIIVLYRDHNSFYYLKTSEILNNLINKTFNSTFNRIKNIDFSNATRAGAGYPLKTENTVFNIQIKYGVLSISSNDLLDLATANFEYNDVEPATNLDVGNPNVVTLTASSDNGDKIELYLPRSKTYVLNIATGASSIDINARDLSTNVINISSGASENTIIVPENISSTINIASGAGHTLFKVPQTLDGIRISNSDGSTIFALEDNSFYTFNNGGYESPNFDENGTNIYITVAQGTGGYDIEIIE